MGVTVTISSIEDLSVEQREHISGFILTFPDQAGNEPILKDTPSIDLSPELSQVAAAFGAPSVISQVGPTLVIPSPPPSAPPVNQVPSLPPPSPAAPVSTSVTLDKTGLPWDARIHAGGKSQNADGTWRGKRGVDGITKDAIEKELRQLMAIPSPGLQLVPPPPPVLAVAAPAMTVASPIPPPSSVTIRTADAMTAYVELVGRTSAALARGAISQEQLKKVCDAVGVANLPQIGIRMDLLPMIAPMIDGIIAGQSA